MCVYSMIADTFAQRLAPWTVPVPAYDADYVRKIIEDFRKAAEAAKIVDALTDQPNCEDPEKLKLLDRITELEAQLGGKYVVKLNNLYWGYSRGDTGWVEGQKNAFRYNHEEVKVAARAGRARIVKLVKRAKV